MELLRRRLEERNNSMNLIPNIIFSLVTLWAPASSLHSMGVSGSDAIAIYLVVVSLVLIMIWFT